MSINYEALAAQCDEATPDYQAAMITAVAAVTVDAARKKIVDCLCEAGAFLDAAVALLPEGAVWRKYTDDSASVYKISPLASETPQKRFDGQNACTPLAITAAFIRMNFAWQMIAARSAANKSERETSNG